MKKIGTIIILLMIIFSLTSCKKTDFSLYSGMYKMSSFEIIEGDEVSFELIEIYEIELTDKGIADHKLKLGVMKKAEEFSNYYDIDISKNEIIFFIKQGMMVSNAEVWEYRDEQIIMKNLLIPIVDKPSADNKTHYRKVNVYFDKELIVNEEGGKN